eukprot:403343176
MKLNKLFKLINVAIVLTTVAGLDSNEEDVLEALSELGASLNGNSVPFGASKNVVPALQNLAEEQDKLSSFQSIDWNKFIGQNWDKYMSQLEDADSRTFGDVDKTLLTLYKDNLQCYEVFSKSIAEIYIGFMKFFDKQRGKTDLSSFEEYYTFESFCQNETNFIDNVQRLGNYLLGSGDCDVLQKLYEGNVSSNIWQGWRDNIDDKAGYLVMYLTEGIITANACQNIIVNKEGYDPNSEESLSRQEKLGQINPMLSQAISRTLEYDQKALTSVEETLQTNLRQLLKEYSGLSLEVMALNVNQYQLATIYGDYLWEMSVVYGNTSSEDYYGECWNCVKMEEGDFDALVAWLPVDSDSSISNNALEQIEYTEGTSDSDLAAQIWNELGNCVSGAAWVKNNVPAYFSNLFEDRFVGSREENITIVVWGVEEICNGRPPV